jgi:hypothetical protein
MWTHSRLIKTNFDTCGELANIVCCADRLCGFSLVGSLANVTNRAVWVQEPIFETGCSGGFWGKRHMSSSNA